MFNSKTVKKKYSYGIILCRKNKYKQTELLLIKKRNSYYFRDFVLGRYNIKNEKSLMKLFNNITFNEKIDILTLNYAVIWNKLWLETPYAIYPKLLYNQNGINKYRQSIYSKTESKFNELVSKNSGEYLKKLITNSTNSESIWEIPKGRKSDSEKDLDAACRELYEETGVDMKDYDIIWNLKPIYESYKDYDTIYTNIYYVAKYNNDSVNKIQFTNKLQISEVECIKWVSLQEIEFLQLNQKTKTRLIKLYRKIIHAYKKYKN